ncbi:MAG: DVU_1553 family AMP-dependent CoA ligase [Eubacteriales bacterium]
MIITPMEKWINTKIQNGGCRLTEEKLEKYQIEAFRGILSYAKERSPFYKDLLNDFDSTKIESRDDLYKIPFTTSEDIRLQGSRMVCVAQGNIHRIVTLDTSGTTGEPKRIYFTKEDQELTIDFFRHGMSTFTYPGDKVLILLPGQTPGSIGDLLKIGLARMDVEGVIYGIVDDVDKVMDIIINQEITGIVGIPQQIFTLTKSEKSDAIRKSGKLKSVLLSTDYVSPSITSIIIKGWGCRVYEHYGMTEMGLGGGVFCEALNGYHMRDADMLFEIIDIQTGQPAKDGEYGEVVFTTLTRKGMPLIRYKTGDISRFLLDPCRCGTVLKTMDRIQSRIVSLMKLKNGQTISMPMLEDIIFSIKGILDFTAEIVMDCGRETLKIGVYAIGDKEIIRGNIYEAIKKSIIGNHIRSGALNIETFMQGCAEPDIKAIRKRNLIDKRNM